MTWIVAMAIMVSGASAASDPFLGRWVLDVAASQYPPGSCPTAMVVEMDAADHGIRYRSDTTYANGNTVRSEYTAAYDGIQALVVGTHGMMLPVSLKRPNSRTVIASYTKGLIVVATSRRVVSEDGRLMTITTTSTDGSGTPTTVVGVYRRQ